FAGLRPLLRSAPGDPSARTREYRLVSSPSGLLTVAGGKYTTYRSMAEAITDEVARRLGVRARCRTRAFPLDGAPRRPWASFAPSAVAELRAGFGLDERSAAHLVGRYGRRAVDVARYQGLGVPVVPGEPDLLAEVAYQRDHEMAQTPADFLLRRTRLGLFHPGLALPALTGAGRGGPGASGR